MGQKIALWVLIVVALVGLSDASYLYYKYLTASSINCFLFDGCNTVAASPYAKPLGIPLSLLGILFYFGMLALVFSYAKWKSSFLKNLLFLGGIVGFLFSLFFVYLQGFVIQAFCVYCMISATSSTIILSTTLYLRENPFFPPSSRG